MIKKILKIFNINDYKPREFWDNWAPTFMNDEWQVQTHPQHTWILKKIKRIKEGKILEIGCGFGRNIKFLIENNISPNRLVGIDISPNMLIKAEELINNKKVKLVESDALSLPFVDKIFSAVLIHGVFMHIKPKDIDKGIKEAIRVSKKYILQVEQNYGGNKYTFVHNYKKLYKKNDAKIIEYKNNKDLGLDYLYVKVR